MDIATCIGCGCDDTHACWDNAAQQPCGWLRVNRESGRGVCSTCPDHAQRWDAGDTAQSPNSVKVVLGNRYTESELQLVKVVELTRTDLVILSWSHEGVSFVPNSEEAVEFAAAELKIDQALERNVSGTVEQVALTLQDLLILSWGHESVSFDPGSDSEAEFTAAEEKIENALEELRSMLADSSPTTPSPGDCGT